MIVVDTNIIAYHHLPSPYTDATIELRHLDTHWLAPALWKSEFKNVLALYIRRKLISLRVAVDLFTEAQLVLVEQQLELSSAEDVLTLVANSTCSSYDCEFVALAQRLDIKLVTEDKKILTEFPTTAMTLAEALNH